MWLNKDENNKSFTVKLPINPYTIFLSQLPRPLPRWLCPIPLHPHCGVYHHFGCCHRRRHLHHHLPVTAATNLRIPTAYWSGKMKNRRVFVLVGSRAVHRGSSQDVAVKQATISIRFFIYLFIFPLIPILFSCPPCYFWSWSWICWKILILCYCWFPPCGLVEALVVSWWGWWMYVPSHGVECWRESGFLYSMPWKSHK